MNNLKIFLKAIPLQTYVVIFTITILNILYFHTNIDILNIEPFIYSILIIWAYFSIFLKIVNNKISFRKIDGNQNYKGSFFNLGIILLLGYQSFCIYGKVGVIIILSIITLTATINIIVLYKEIFISKNNQFNDKNELSSQLFVSAGFVLFFYFFFIGKPAFCYEFGVEEIGSFFEKRTYEAQYLIKIKKLNDTAIFELPANFIISRDFSEYVSYEVDKDMFGPYSITDEIRYVKLKKVYFPNNILKFNNCIIPVESHSVDNCSDENGIEWFIHFTNKKVK